MIAKKTDKGNLENKRGLFLLVGFAVVLALIYAGFELFASEDKAPAFELQDDEFITVVDDDVIATDQTPPPPQEQPQQQQEVVLNIVEDNIKAILELQVDEKGAPLSKEEIGKRLEQLMNELQIAHLRSNMAMSLSGGERRRTEIARALASSPRFILLDEPFAGVDPLAVKEIQKIVYFLKSRGIGVLITDHNVRETLGICDHAYIIKEGTVFAEGSADQLIADPEVRKAYLGEDFHM